MTTETLSCGIVLLRQGRREPRTLLLRAWHHWDFPKGMREDGEDAKQTAIRELSEETGISDARFDWGDVFFETGPYGHGKKARYYLASTETREVVMGLSPETGQPEHHEWRWFSFDEAFDIATPRVREVVRWARQFFGT